MASSKFPMVKFTVDGLDTNFHGPNKLTLRRTARLVQMGAHCQVWKLYIYRANGSCRGFSIAFPRWRREWTP
jgi:hypothetical protein